MNTGQRIRDGMLSAFAGANQWDCDLLNPYKDKTYFNAEVYASEWEEGFMKGSDSLSDQEEAEVYCPCCGKLKENG